MSVLRLVACGGGAIYDPVNALIINAGLAGAGKSTVRILYVPTALCSRRAYYYDTILLAGKWGNRTKGVQLEVMHHFGAFPTLGEAAEQLGRADLVYIEDGDLQHLLRIWADNGFCELLQNGAAQGDFAVMGSGAGAGALFSRVCTDNRHTLRRGERLCQTVMDGLGLVDALCCTHYGWPREQVLVQALRAEPEEPLGVGICSSAAIQVNGETVTILGAGDHAGYVVRRRMRANGYLEGARHDEGWSTSLAAFLGF